MAAIAGISQTVDSGGVQNRPRPDVSHIVIPDIIKDIPNKYARIRNYVSRFTTLSELKNKFDFRSDHFWKATPILWEKAIHNTFLMYVIGIRKKEIEAVSSWRTVKSS